MRKVLFEYSPHFMDELRLAPGDFVYANDEQVKGSSDNWCEGVLHSTGSNGHLPLNYTQRASETEVWTMHKCVHLFLSFSPLSRTSL